MVRNLYIKVTTFHVLVKLSDFFLYINMKHVRNQLAVDSDYKDSDITSSTGR